MSKILLVEDDPLIQEMYATIFNLRGFDVELANDGAQGLDKAEITKPDVILLDVMMPVMNGMQMLEKLKADSVLKKIPVVMLSNIADDEDIHAALDRGAIKYIIKSEHVPQEVADMVKEILLAQRDEQIKRTQDQADKNTK